MFNLKTLAPIAALIIGGSLTASLASAAPVDYKIDGAHSRVSFTVKHMMISSVTGTFKDFDGDFFFDSEKFTGGGAKFVVQAASVDTGNAKRDEHLRSPDFFDVAKFPTLSVTNSKITKAGKDKFKWAGDLTIHGVTKPVTFDLEYKGSIMDPYGTKRAAFTATTIINRKDYGLTWNKAMEAGGVVVGEDVTVQIDIEATEAKPAGKADAKAPAAPAKKK
jgi:polyisoprenoid-binding protein YceI